MRTNALAIAALLSVGLSSCHEKARYPSYGLKSVEIRMTSEDAGAVAAGAGEGLEYPATVILDGDAHRATVSAAGATSIHSPKKNLNLRFTDGFRYRGAEVVRISANVGDDSMIRPLLALDVLAQAGLPNSWIEPAFVHLNDRILGIYLMIERVDDDYFRNRGIRWSRLYEAKGNADFGPTFEAQLELTMEGKPKPQDLTAMIALRRTLDETDDSAFSARVFAILDRDAVVNYMAAAQVIFHFDGFNKNLFYYQSPDDLKLRFAPWDFDLTWPVDREANLDAWYLNALFARIGRLTAVRADIDGKVASLVAGNASKASLGAKIFAWRDRLAEAAAHDPEFVIGGRSISTEADRLFQTVSARIDALP